MSTVNTNPNEPIIVTKMSLRGIGCSPVGLPEPGKRLCVIFGRADGIKTGEDNNCRVWSALTGNFEAYRFPQEGEPEPQRYQSGKLFLPGGIHETIENAVRQIQSGGEATAGMSVKFGLELRSVKANNPIGYSYQAIAVLPVEQTDDLSELRRAIMEAGKTQLDAGPTPIALPSPEVPVSAADQAREKQAAGRRR